MSKWLKNLPLIGTGFTDLNREVITLREDDPSSPSPRKAPRLDPSLNAKGKTSKGKGKERAGAASGSSSPAARTIYVMNSTPRRELPTEYLNKLTPHVHQWIKITLSPPYASAPPAASYESIYQACQVLVTVLNQGKELSNYLKLELERAVVTTFRNLPRSEEGMKWLGTFTTAWEWYEDRLEILRSGLLYLDRVYFAEAKPDGFADLREMGRECWRRSLMRGSEFPNKVRDGIREWVTIERDATLSDNKGKGTFNAQSRATIKTLIGNLIIIGVYGLEIEPAYGEETKIYYEAESKRLSATMSHSKYLLHCAARIEQEEMRLRDCLPQETWKMVIKYAEDSLIRTQASEFALKGVSELAASKEVAALTIVHRLYGRVNALASLRDAFKKYVQAQVEEVVLDKDQDPTMIDSLIKLRAFVNDMLYNAFHENVKGYDNGKAPIKRETDGEESDMRERRPVEQANSFTYAALDAMTNGVSKRRNKPAEMIAKYIDAEMKRGQRDASEAEFHKKLDEVLALYRLTADKDVFREYYLRALAKRLLLGRTASDDFEKNVLAKLEHNYDPEFSNGQKMFQDLERSHGLMEGFHNVHPEDDNMTVMVLQPPKWPTYKVEDIILPLDMSESLQHFADFYKTQHTAHVLTWAHGLGTVTLTARFPKGVKELSVSLYQAVVLLLFNDDVEELTYADILERTGIEGSELKRTLQSLALGKKRVLVKKPMSKDVNESDAFSFNVKFEDKARNVRINSIQAQETEEENKATEKQIDLDRIYVLDAAMVRIMKAKKQLKFEDLKIQTIDAVKSHFRPAIPEIKKQLDSLIEREYISRDGISGDLVYVA